MRDYKANVIEEIMELLREKVDEQLDVLDRHDVQFRPEEFCSLSESGRLAKIVRECRKMERKRKHSSDESDEADEADEKASKIKRTRNSTSTSTAEDSSSYDEMHDGTESDPPNIVVGRIYQTTEGQTDPIVKQDVSTQTDDVMI